MKAGPFPPECSVSRRWPKARAVAGVLVDARGADAPSRGAQTEKPATPAQEKKTPGTVVVEKYRSAMNKLTDAERERLMAVAMVPIYGEPENAGCRRFQRPARSRAGNRARDGRHERIAGAGGAPGAWPALAARRG